MDDSRTREKLVRGPPPFSTCENLFIRLLNWTTHQRAKIPVDNHGGGTRKADYERKKNRTRFFHFRLIYIFKKSVSFTFYVRVYRVN